jgi:hypothetical protein
VAQLGADPPIAVSLELIADNDDFRDEFDVAHRCLAMAFIPPKAQLTRSIP